MIINKITKLSVAVAVLGFGILAACSEDNVASSYSETNTGKPVIRSGMPIAELDTSYIRKAVVEGGGCGSLLAKSAADVESDGSTEVDSVETVEYFRISCAAHDDIHLYIKTRAQIVDSEGLPVVGATVYEQYCSFEDKRCQHVTDKDGYFYIDSVNFLTYLQMDNPKNTYLPEYQIIQLRALSADSSLGANVFKEFLKATVYVVGDDPVADLGKIVVEPVYTAKVYLDSLFATVDESTPESDKPYIEEWNKKMTKNLGDEGDGICVALNEVEVPPDVRFVPSFFYPCYKLTEEDYKNGYVTLFGLPEGKYRIDIDGFWCKYLPTLVVEKP